MTSDLQKQIDSATTEFEFPRGRVQIDALKLDRREGLSLYLHADTVLEFPAVHQQMPCIAGRDCQGVRIVGGAIDCPGAHSQGTVTEINPNDKQFTVLLDHGFPLPTAINTKVVVFSPDGERMLPVPLEHLSHVVHVTGRQVTVETRQGSIYRAPDFSPGVRVSLVDRARGRIGIHLRDSSRCSLEGVTIHRMPNMGVIALGCVHTVFDRVRVARPAVPLILGTTGADGFMSMRSHVDTFSHCSAEFAGDDCLSIRGTVGIACLLDSGGLVVLAHVAQDVPIGPIEAASNDFSKRWQDEVLHYDAATSDEDRAARYAAAKYGVRADVAERENTQAFRIRLKGAAVKPGDWLWSKSRMPLNPKVIGCTFTNGFNRGAIVTGREIEVRRNIFADLGGAAVCVGAAGIDFTGPAYGGDVTGNTIVRPLRNPNKTPWDRPISIGDVGGRGGKLVPTSGITAERNAVVL